MEIKVTEQKTYLPTTEPKHFIRVEMDYSLGGCNYFTYKQEQRGYYLHVTPVERDGMWESFTAFTGIKYCVLPVSRRSDKSFRKAIEIANENNLAMKLIQHLLDKGATFVLAEEEKKASPMPVLTTTFTGGAGEVPVAQTQTQNA